LSEEIVIIELKTVVTIKTLHDQVAKYLTSLAAINKKWYVKEKDNINKEIIFLRS
jgi:hypothetical protein